MEDELKKTTYYIINGTNNMKVEEIEQSLTGGNELATNVQVDLEYQKSNKPFL